MGFVLSAAFLEWFLWLAAFLYCLVKVWQKAEHWTVKLMAALMMIAFTGLRCATLGLTLATKLTLSQVHLSPCHGRHPPTSTANNVKIPSRDGLISTVVRFLFIRRPVDHTVVILYLPTRCQQSWTNQEDQDGIGRGLGT